MPILRRITRLVLLFFHVLKGVALLLFAVGPDPLQRSTKDWQIICRWMQRLCTILGLRISVSGQALNAPVLFVANHISWHDIVAIQSLVPTGFIAKQEIRHWPIVGWMAYRGNTLFIKRGKREALPQIIKAMQERFEQKQNILIFPEGTTSTGETVLPFRTRLFEPAIKLELPLQPVAIRYSSPDKSSKDLAFVDDMGFLEHAVRMLGEPFINVDIHFGQIVETSSGERREIGELAQQHVLQAMSADHS